jgi:DNA-binding IclR family transcriptional regulator
VKQITRTVLKNIARIPPGDAYWTSDIAYDCRMDTAKTRRQLEELQRLGYAEKVAPGGAGYPASWRITDLGRAALPTPPTGGSNG